MKITNTTRSGLSIFLMLPVVAFAYPLDSTSPGILPSVPVVPRCFTVRVGSDVLNITPVAVTSEINFTECTWRGSDTKAGWGGAISNATYEQSCDADEVSIGVRFGFRGAYAFGGGYDLYTHCCKVEVKYTMSQDWVSCPS